MDRFFRTRILLGDDKLKELNNSTCAIAGMGAVGGYCCEMLARSGIGNFILCDFDTVEVTNINRQIFALESTIGELKTDTAEKRILDINPDAKITKISEFINAENFHLILEQQPDIIIDAIDSVKSKADLIEGAVNNEIPILCSMGAALKRDPLKIHFTTIKKTHTCPLARNLRQALKKRNLPLNIPCVFTDEQPFSNPLHRNTKEAGLGSIPTVTSIFGIYLADRAINMLLEEKTK
jgi:tRNA A37 threonylcarbamoyladenosine dehydratase